MAPSRRPTRTYSREFTPGAREKRRTITIDRIPADLLDAVRKRAKRDGVSLRSLLLTYLQTWVDENGPRE